VSDEVDDVAGVVVALLQQRFPADEAFQAGLLGSDRLGAWVLASA
jgi:hypothetical protein